MRLSEAAGMLDNSGLAAPGPTTWADLGCGTGTFTLALAEQLASGSTIHAMDRDAAALRQIPPAHRNVRIATHRGDFTKPTWPFGPLDGILLANSLHYVGEPATFIRQCETAMTSPGRFLIVEYDTHQSGPWVPYPVPKKGLGALFAPLGYSSITLLGSRSSIYRRAALYAALIAP